MASTYLTRTPSTASNQNTFTISTWVKKCNTSGNKIIFSQGIDNGEFFTVRLDTRGYLGVFHLTSAGNTYESILSTQRVLRDNNAFYHIVVAVDTTQSIASDRTKIYINGNLITDFVLPDENVYPNQNFNSYVNTTNVVTIGAKPAGGDEFDGVMSHFHFIDGTQYQASDFGEYDANGVWTINTSPSVTYGTNGFFILKDGNSVTDQSGNGNNFTVGGGTLTNTEDNPSNVFATYNANVTQTAGTSGRNASANISLANGNLSAGAGAAIFADQVSTLGFTKGKYYAEFQTTGDTYTAMGIVNQKFIDAYLGFYIGSEATSGVNNIGYQSVNGEVKKNNSTQYTGSTFTSANDIIGVAVDLDNNYIYFAKNGVWQNSGVPTSGATGTGGVSITADEYFFAVSSHNNAQSGTEYIHANFGNGYFGTTAVASAGTNASGFGIFEYDVPTGFTALCTKGLNGE